MGLNNQKLNMPRPTVFIWSGSNPHGHRPHGLIATNLLTGLKSRLFCSMRTSRVNIRVWYGPYQDNEANQISLFTAYQLPGFKQHWCLYLNRMSLCKRLCKSVYCNSCSVSSELQKEPCCGLQASEITFKISSILVWNIQKVLQLQANVSFIHLFIYLFEFF